MTKGDVKAKVLASVPHVCVVFMPPAEDKQAGASGGVIADGVLEVMSVPAGAGAAEQLILGIAGSSEEKGFWYPIVEGAQAVVDEHRKNLTIPDVINGGMRGVYGLHAHGEADLHEASAVLTAHGCHIVEQTGKGLDREAEVDDTPRVADKVAGGLLNAGTALAGSIYTATEALSAGLHGVFGSVKESKAMAPTGRPVAVPAVVTSEVGHMREATRTVAVLSQGLVKSIANVAGEMTEQLRPEWAGDGADDPRARKGLKNDARIVGEAGIAASLQVLHALYTANVELTTNVADGSAELVAHKYGGEVGDVYRDALHIGGNIQDAQFSKKHLAKKAAGKTAEAVAGRRDTDQAVLAPLHAAMHGDKGGIVLGPR